MSEGVKLQIIPNDCDITVDGEGWEDNNVVTQWQVLGDANDNSMAIVVVQFGRPNEWDDFAHDAIVSRVLNCYNALEGYNPAAVRDMVEALRFVRMNPYAHPANMVAVCTDALAAFEGATADAAARAAAIESQKAELIRIIEESE